MKLEPTHLLNSALESTQREYLRTHRTALFVAAVAPADWPQLLVGLPPAAARLAIAIAREFRALPQPVRIACLAGAFKSRTVTPPAVPAFANCSSLRARLAERQRRERAWERTEQPYVEPRP